MSFHKDVLRTTRQAVLQTMYLLQIGAGSLANIILFFHNISPILLGHKQRPTHTVLTHMAVANILVLLTSGIPHIMMAFVWRSPLSSLGCKCVYYLQRVARSTTLCSTCVLSTCQFFTLIPGRPEWMMLRGRASRFAGPSSCTCWVFSVLMYIHVPLKITGPQDMYNSTDTQGRWFCSAGTHDGFGYFASISDAMFIGLTVWSSGSMLLLLHRHHQRVQYIHTHTGHHQCRPETRAAHTILMLVVTFAIFYVLNSLFIVYMHVFLDFHLWLLQTSNVLVSCFPTVSPFVLLFRNPRTPKCCSLGILEHRSAALELL
ncbi:vomeronasal type-1 receptor 4 [Sus scrofa]|uniref:Vomeronasal type-1 receptor n=2 Tax=Sus scrofa TaxID=9823 RepID=A0A0G3VQH2_PIG|nr:vomeronasal type-1 receptor 4 [Sus scrofa]AKL82265.1 vomeronasal receptor sV1RD2 [Sus scrofa]